MMLKTANTRTGGDVYRAKMADLNWVANADAVQLRAAVHALCWRNVRSTLDAIASDSRIAAKVLVVSRGVRDELAARADAAVDDADERQSLRRRLASAEAIVSSCHAAVQLAAWQPSPPDEQELIDAISRHRRKIDPDDACEADMQLWKVLDRIEHRPSRGDMV